ncbi:amidophosphoribosyltransferase [Kingella kingae]|uniref:amidophosphoribosyltransferase n=1 Tax=Kingella kingae TaxID=504 RepID=UPI000423332C|nr:amidophosphoribosyltransferase [Kingella kingae]MDK4564711.1 amidophosphoribosyltransferase [Kingella kingae]MDK4579279.1 amidophosphoribosyltransferase [Kingella kingae]MDK4609080.1 amidophosphoribosyltransferase [Kingella kingae]MDK4627044.1 amidophosphoribosyltransferase [Kingella kingae]MDK4674766.1 amidophosphoribosyltransferase [Kingella kingae]
MCGVLGLVAHQPVNQLLYDGLQMLQHRGQDAAGIVTTQNACFHMHKGKGMVREVFRTHNMLDLHGNAGIAHVRYPTAGNAGSSAEAQPFYVSSPFGIVLAHNGNLTNTAELHHDVYTRYLRHVNTQSDSEVLLNVFAHELRREVSNNANPIQLLPDNIFNAIERVHERVRGAYGVVAMIAGYGMVAFRDPNGIRPLVLGKREEGGKTAWAVSSESVVFGGLAYQLERDIAPGEALFIDFAGNLHSRQCAKQPHLKPCLFEYVYFARPDSVVDGVPVYQARADMGITLADKVKQHIDVNEIDVVMPIPDTSRSSALELAARLGKPYREGLIKNRYIGRTFIMPGQATRKKSVRQKLNPIASEFAGKNVLLVDDSIVRGTTSREIVDMVREAGAKKVFFASAAPEVRYPNVYGIDMPTREELIANGRTATEIAQEINADACIFQDLDALEQVVRRLNSQIEGFDDSCFSGCYVTGDIDDAYLDALSAHKKQPASRIMPSLVEYSVSIENGNE